MRDAAFCVMCGITGVLLRCSRRDLVRGVDVYADVDGGGVRVRLTQIDGALPNLALMKLAHWHRSKGDTVVVTRRLEPDLFEDHNTYDRVYASAIFDFSAPLVQRFRRAWRNPFIGGTGSGSKQTIEELIGVGSWEYEHYDYVGQTDPDDPTRPFTASIGFAQRGCRLNCPFCGVRGKEGPPRAVNTIETIWRGEGHPKKLHLLDNDFFGVPEWRERISEIRDGGFKVCLSQGINVRLINKEAAAALATIQYRNTRFNERRLYTAWDNLGHEKVFFRGVDMLERAGIPPKHLMTYMLIGFDAKETWRAIWHRFDKMVERGIAPYPMVFDRSRTDLLCFQRWVITGLYRIVPWDEYERSTKSQESVDAYLQAEVMA